MKRTADNVTSQDDQAQAAMRVIETTKAAGAKSVKVKMTKDASIGFMATFGKVRLGVTNDGVVELEVVF